MRTTNKIPMVDFFKGIAILMVIIVHSGQIFGLPDTTRALTNFGQMGVQVFFLMSGFTLCYSNSNFWKRILKILPGYWSIVFINFLITFIVIPKLGITMSYTSQNVWDYLLNLVFLHGLAPTAANNHVVLGGWFVGTLVIFYIIFPYVFKLCKWLNDKSCLPPPLLLFLVCFTIIHLPGVFNSDLLMKNNTFLYFSFVNQLPVFVLGISLHNIVSNKKNVSFPIIKGIILIVVSFILFTARCTHFIYSIVPFLFSTGVLFLYLGLKDIKIKDNYVNRVILAFNKYSFSIYLTHPFIVYYLMSVILKMFRMLEMNMSATFEYLVNDRYSVRFS